MERSQLIDNDLGATDVGSEGFAELFRLISESPTRRGICRTLAMLTLSGGVSRISTSEAVARRKKRKKKCKNGTKKCGKKCVDPQTDPLNCGSCGNRCDDDMECRSGECVCPEGETECGETCCANGQNCVEGHCEEELCPPEFTCPSGQFCLDGECVCPFGETACEEACCASGVPCVDGQCTDALCPPQFVCPLGQACVNGDCTCPAGACDAADDPTNDQFEGCFCATTVEGEQVCFANGPCSSPPPTCSTSAECGAGFACNENSCGGVSRCSQLCDLS